MVTTFGRAGIDENNTLKKQTDTRNADVGFIKPFAGNTVPDGYLYCDGSAVSRTTYSELFAAIGTIYGAGDGSTTFNVPDLRGYFLRGDGGTNSAAMGKGQGEMINTRTLLLIMQRARPASGNNVSGSRGTPRTIPPVNSGNNAFLYNANGEGADFFYGYSADGTVITADGDPLSNIPEGGGLISTTWQAWANRGTETRPANFSMKYCIGY